ncbi:hypothetical protein [Actinophytocola sp. KF-1]
MREKATCGLALLLALATACSPAVDDGGRGTTEPEYPAAQAWALADGVVTESEYRTAVDGFVSCMRDAGYQVTDPVLSPVDGLSLLYDLEFSGDPAAWNAKVEECNLGHVSHIEPSYVEEREQVMHPELRSATARCLNGKGVRLNGREHNVKDFYEAAGEQEDAARECVRVAMVEEFPDYPRYVRIRW